MTRDEENRLKARYASFDKTRLQSERNNVERGIEQQKRIWANTSFAWPIIGIFFGGIFSFVLIGIPLLVFSIRLLVRRIQTRARANRAIWHAQEEIKLIDEAIRNCDMKESAVEVDVEVINPQSNQQ